MTNPLSSFLSHTIEEAAVAHECIEVLIEEPWLAVDMEFYWRDTYFPQLCLLQVASDRESVVIDWLSAKISQEDGDRILRKLAQHPCLVFHSGRQDWQIFQQYIGIMPKKVIDIQYAGIYFGLGESPSLSRLVQGLLQKPKDDSAQCSDWRVRPLSSSQLSYARADVESIAMSYLNIQQQLDKKQQKAIIEDSDESLAKAQIKTPVAYLASQQRGYDKLSIHHQLVLQKLMVWRENTAMESNRPVNWVISTSLLLACATVKDSHLLCSLTVMKKNRGKNTEEKFSTIKPKYQQQIRSIYQQVMQLSEDKVCQQLYPPQVRKIPKISQAQSQIVAKLRDYVDDIIKQNDLLSEGMIGKKMLLYFLQHPQQNPLMGGWRYYFIGEKLIQLSQQEIQQWNILSNE